jgi:hypothetical protein
MPQSEELLTRPEAAALLRVKPATLGQWAYRGCGPKFLRPDGGRCLYRQSDLDAWLAGGEIVPGRVGLAEARP